MICAAHDRFRSIVMHDLPLGVVDDLLFESDLDRALERCDDGSIAAHLSASTTFSGNARGALLERVAPDMEEHS